MAAAQKEKKVHAYLQIGEDLRNRQITGPLLFCGREDFLIRWAIGLLEKQWIHPAARELDRTVLSWENTEPGDLAGYCEPVPMLSEKRLVILRDIKGAGEELAAALDRIPDTCRLVMLWEDPDKRTKGYKEILKRAREYDFGMLQEDDLKKYIGKRLRQADKTLDASGMAQLIHRTGYYDKDSQYTLQNLENDLKKMIAHSTSPVIGEEDIRAGISGNMEANVFDLMDAIGSGRKEEAFRLFHSLMVTRDNLYYLLAMVIGQFETLLEVCQLREEGMDADDIQRMTGIHQCRVKKAMQQGGQIPVSRLKETLSRLYEVDRSVKNGRMDGVLALELIIAGA